jgi:DNA-binding NarL/FixJ family response regulator
VATGSDERSAILLGAASQMWESIGAQLYGSEHWIARREQFESRARANLGASQFRECRDRGTHMSVSELIRFALDEPVLAESPPSERSADHLTVREREVAEYICRGLSNKEIAAAMVISPRTVDGHVARVLRKLGVTRRSQVSDAFAQ